MFSRKTALKLLHQHVKSQNMINHCLASEAVMRALANHLNEDVELWGMAGLLHDLDVELVKGDMCLHGAKTLEILKEYDMDEDLLDAIFMHNESCSGKQRTRVFQHALAAGETITGLIVATTLVYQDKKIQSVKPKSVIKRMKEKKFAASVRREHIMECEKIGIPLPEFVSLSLAAMSTISDQLGL